jgi:diguanylate cyclase (GGDEF)-like protein
LLFENISLPQGLKSSEVLQTFQQSNDFIWFATARGASRYDGHAFEHYYYQPGAEKHLSNNFVTKMVEDNKGFLWVGTEDGLNRINLDGSVTLYKESSGLTSTWITNLYIDAKKKLWVSTGEGIFIYHYESDSFVEITGEIPLSVVYFDEDSEGNIWILDNKIILRSRIDNPFFELIDLSVLNLNVDYIFLSIHFIKPNVLAIGTKSEGLLLWNIENDSVEKMDVSAGLLSNNITTIYKVNDEELWLGHYDHGLSIVNLKSKNITYIKSSPFDIHSLPSDSINDIFFDQQNIAWISTNNGVAKLVSDGKNTRLYRALPNNKGLSSNQIIMPSLFNGTKLLVANEVSVDLVDIENGQIKKDFFKLKNKSGFKDIKIWSIIDLEANIWMASSKGILRFNKKSASLKHFSNAPGNLFGLPHRDIYTLLADPRGGVWFTGYIDVGLQYFDPIKNTVIKYLNTNDHLYTREGNYTYQKILSSSGDIWMATTDGLFRVNRDNGEYQHYKFVDGLENIRASSIEEGEEGVFWVTTEGVGLVKVQSHTNTKEVTMTYYNKEMGLPSNELITMSIDEDLIWLSTIDEIFTFNVKTEKINILKGLLTTNINVTKREHFEPTFEFTEVSSNERRINSPGMKGNAFVSGNDIQFEFAALDYKHPEQIQYSFRLKGKSEQWSEAANINTTHFYDLPPGQYAFQVKYTNSDGVWLEKIKEYKFKIKMPFYYYVFIVILLVLIVIIIQYLRSRKKTLQLLKDQVRHDFLTTLPNRFDFNENLNKLTKNHQRNFTLMMIDLDKFKDINDLYGHGIGDKFIVSASIRMKESLRDNDYIARLGGDEFVIIIERHISIKALHDLTVRIQQNLAQPYTFGGLTVQGSGSIGVATFPKDGNYNEILFTHADAAMYQAKQQGRNQVYFFNDELKNRLDKSITIKTYLSSALKNKEFELYYQPKMKDHGKNICGYEALIRWNHPTEGFMTPHAFIHEAELSGDILEIGKWVVEQACLDAMILMKNDQLPGDVSVNISAMQLKHDSLIDVIKSALTMSGLPPEKLELEITESSLVDDTEQAFKLLTQLKLLGVSIALDDFGTGYSSLSYLTKFPIDTLKIDSSFIWDAYKNKASKVVLENIYVLAHSLNMKVVSEGIETKEHEMMLEKYSNDLLQGYLYCRPISLEKTMRLNTEMKKKSELGN